MQRLICADLTKVHNVIDPLLAANKRDYIFVIVNDTTYGGSGGSILVSSINTSAVGRVANTGSIAGCCR